jgi:hypothetical protein
MANVDQFESIFRSSVKESLEYHEIPMRSVLLITDLQKEAALVYKKRVQQFLSILSSQEQWDCFLVTGDEFRTTEDLLQLVEGYALDLICSYRNLHSSAWRFPHSLGEHLDVLIQKTPLPVLILPHPEAAYMADHAMQDTREVMVVTDMVAINHELINYAVRLTRPGGTLFLSHVENLYIFERYIDAIGKIESLNTEVARTRLAEQLLKEPEDYFLSCADILKEHNIDLDVRSMVTLGNAVAEYRRQIDSRKLDLLVMHARDEGQQAMNAVAYPLAVELRQVPLLMV